MKHTVAVGTDRSTIEFRVGSRVVPVRSIGAAVFNNQAVRRRELFRYREVRVSKSFLRKFCQQKAPQLIISDSSVGNRLDS